MVYHNDWFLQRFGQSVVSLTRRVRLVCTYRIGLFCRLRTDLLMHEENEDFEYIKIDKLGIELRNFDNRTKYFIFI